MKKENILSNIVLGLFVLGMVGTDFVSLPHQGGAALASGTQAVIASTPISSTDGGQTYSKMILMKDYPPDDLALRTKSDKPGDPNHVELPFLADTRTLGGPTGRCNYNMPTDQYGNDFSATKNNSPTRYQVGGAGMFVDNNQLGGWLGSTFTPQSKNPNDANYWPVAPVKTLDYYNATKDSTKIDKSLYLSSHWDNYSDPSFTNFDQIGYPGTTSPSEPNGHNNYDDTGFKTPSPWGSLGCIWADETFKTDPNTGKQTGHHKGAPILDTTPTMLIGGETVLYVRKFNLATPADVTAANNGQIGLEAVSDDWSKAWLNGYPLGQGTLSSLDDPSNQVDVHYGKVNGSFDPTPVNPENYSLSGDVINNPRNFQLGSNTLAFQVTNKIHWDVEKSLADQVATMTRNEHDNPGALYFRLYFDQASQASLGCRITANPTNVNRGATTKLTWTTTGSPVGNATITEAGNAGTIATLTPVVGTGAVGVTVTPDQNYNYTAYTMSVKDAAGVEGYCSTYTTLTTPSFSCSVSPITGLAPLVVRVTTTPTNLGASTFTYHMGDTTPGPETVLRTKPATVYYTYSNAGNYQITVTSDSHPELGAQSCLPSPVQVNNPTGGDTGEVNPN